MPDDKTNSNSINANVNPKTVLPPPTSRGNIICSQLKAQSSNLRRMVRRLA